MCDKKPGRPPKINPNDILTLLQKYKNRIFRDNGKVTSKSDEVWEEISVEMENTASLKEFRKTASALYTYMTCNKNSVREQLAAETEQPIQSDKSIFEPANVHLSILDSSLDLTGDLGTAKEVLNFMIHVPGTDFDELLVKKRLKDKRSKDGYRERMRLAKGEWTGWISEKIFQHTRRKCAYYFRYHTINEEASSGHMSGACNCGSCLEIYFKRTADNVIAFKCSIMEGNDVDCGKVYLRGSERKTVARELQKKSVYVYRAAKADELMTEGQCEPGILRKANTMRAAKSEMAAASHVDPDPVQALYKIKLLKESNTIHNIGLMPFYVHYSTKHQHTVYKAIARREPVSVAIDATGSIIRPIQRPNKSTSGPIFLYIVVARTTTGPNTVCAMLSERHHTNAMCFWLEEWIATGGLPIPKEIVCDASKALLAGAIRAFTGFATINDYVNALAGDVMPPCYIRIDIAHFLKKYADLLSNVRSEVKKFYLSSLGKLVRCLDLEEAQKIVYALLTISLSSSDGYMENGKVCVCQNQKNFMNDVLTTPIEDMEEEDNRPVSCLVDEEEPEKYKTNTWSKWAIEIEHSVKEDIATSEGKGVNAHWSPEFVSRFFDDLKWLPLWACVVQQKFGYGRVPASSAHVECEFKNIKRLLLSDKVLPMRLDDFVTKHIAHLSGTTKITHAAIIQEDRRTAEEVENVADSNGNEVSDAGNATDFNGNEISDAENVTESDENEASADINFDSDQNNSSRQRKKQRPYCANCTVGECTIGKNLCKDCTDLQETVQLMNKVDFSPTLMSGCSACANGDIPGGAHKCVICENAVHALESCSKPYKNDNEGYGQRRICNGCKNQENNEIILESRERENWGGQIKTPPRQTNKRKKTQKESLKVEQQQPSIATRAEEKENIRGKGMSLYQRRVPKNTQKPPQEKKRTGRYLQEIYPKNTFQLQPVLATIPILRPGDDNGLQSIRIGESHIDFIHTCAFDSLFQLFLTASFDSEKFLQRTVKANAKNNDFFKLLESVHDSGVTASAYRLRGKILCSLFEKTGTADLNCHVVDCESTIPDVCRMLLASTPSFCQTTTCNASCSESSTNFALLPIKETSLRATDYASTIASELALDDTNCLKLGCTGKNRYKIIVAGEFVLFEIVADFDPASDLYRDAVMPLQTIPKALKLPGMKSEFHLRGLVNWKPPPLMLTRRSAPIQELGHYTAVCCRNGLWEQIDNKKRTRPPKTSPVMPHVLMYSS